MTDFLDSYNLCRTRFADSVLGLNQAQLNWRLHDQVLTIGESAIHVAGVEMWFLHQLTGEPFAGFEKVMQSATAGVVNDDAFPFAPEEITPGFVAEVLGHAQAAVRPHLESPSAEFLAKEIKSALGPIINGRGALARLAFHPGYHHGQVYMIATAPGFPA